MEKFSTRYAQKEENFQIKSINTKPIKMMGFVFKLFLILF